MLYNNTVYLSLEITPCVFKSTVSIFYENRIYYRKSGKETKYST